MNNSKGATAKKNESIYGDEKRNDEALKELASLVQEYFETESWGEININLREGVVHSIIKSVRTKI
ncbi:hypothetical protein M902_1827 [Bacteriovorax sp. BAL6_X]|uniref:hypothetical protein n=1 Tax=Bacteriovorax sp. BAL6_X TaxID=1201290 RepID=UPI000386B35D|nr:hypothetical protein [Bacteriovorax sp. BAL6_X]EPZ51980.1 hypothetical protein M902_1827 [Bacteriovorax sp. BAL6_X]